MSPGIDSTARFIPALSTRWLAPLYDPLLRWGMREKVFKRRLIQSAGIKPGQHVLDLGCGTGTLTLMIKQSVPRAYVTGLDGDPLILAIARRKAAKANISIQWDEGMAYALPYVNHSFDVIVSSLVIHHLVTEDKRRAFREVYRVLRPGGMFRIADFGRPFNTLTYLQAAVMQNLEEAKDNFRGRLSGILKDAGFEDVSELDRLNTIFGPIWLYSGAKGLGAQDTMSGLADLRTPSILAGHRLGQQAQEEDAADNRPHHQCAPEAAVGKP